MKIAKKTVKGTTVKKTMRKIPKYMFKVSSTDMFGVLLITAIFPRVNFVKSSFSLVLKVKALLSLIFT